MSARMLKTTTLRAKDLSCPSCVGKIESALNALDGVEKAEVKFNSGRILVDHNPVKIRTTALVKAVASAGYVAEPSAF
jgi:copper chaperone